MSSDTAAFSSCFGLSSSGESRLPCRAEERRESACGARGGTAHIAVPHDTEMDASTKNSRHMSRS
jgi:hypothetical protein